MTSYVGSIDVRNGHVEPSAGTAHFLGRSYNRFRVSKNLTHSIATGYVPQGTMLEFAGCADNGSLTVAFDDFGVSAQCDDEGTCHFETQRFEVIHEACNLFHVSTCKGI